jgi:putative endopeptidase
VVGKVYVEQHFPAERKKQVEAMVQELPAGLQARHRDLDWMTPETKKQAQAKLAKINVKIGYPDKWRDYSSR